MTGRADRHVVMDLLGGSLTLDWSPDDGHVYQEGTAQFVLTASGWGSKPGAYPYIICRKVDIMFPYQRLFTRLPGSYLFAEIARRVKAYSAAHPDADIIRLGIGDVTRPLAPATHREGCTRRSAKCGCAGDVPRLRPGLRL